ncbi:unnamed protein product, partial [Strongylus vulgaris]
VNYGVFRRNWFLILSGAAVVVTLADLILLVLIFVLAMKKRKSLSNDNETKKKPPQKDSSPVPEYPFPEFTHMASSSVSASERLSDADGVKRIDEVIRMQEEEERRQ